MGFRGDPLTTATGVDTTGGDDTLGGVRVYQDDTGLRATGIVELRAGVADEHPARLLTVVDSAIAPGATAPQVFSVGTFLESGTFQPDTIPAQWGLRIDSNGLASAVLDAHDVTIGRQIGGKKVTVHGDLVAIGVPGGVTRVNGRLIGDTDWQAVPIRTAAGWRGDAAARWIDGVTHLSFFCEYLGTTGATAPGATWPAGSFPFTIPDRHGAGATPTGPRLRPSGTVFRDAIYGGVTREVNVLTDGRLLIQGTGTGGVVGGFSFPATTAA